MNKRSSILALLPSSLSGRRVLGACCVLGGVGALSCGNAEDSSGADDSSLEAAATSPGSSSSEPGGGSLVGSGGIVAVPNASGPAARPAGGAPSPSPVGGPVAASPNTTPPAGDGQTPSAAPSASQGGTPAEEPEPDVLANAGAPSSNAGAASGGASDEETGAAGSEASASGAPGSAGAGPANGGASSGVDEAPVFQRPAGTIPNSPEPGSVVGIDQSAWASGLISPNMDEGHQVNQPAVLDGYLVVGGNEEFWSYDVSDPSAPRRLSNFTTPNRRVGGEAESHTISFARYGDSFYMVTIGGTGIDTWDMTDQSSPKHLGQVAIAGTNYGDYTEAVWGVSWQGQYIYVGATNNGISVVDASDPSNLDVVTTVPTSSYGGVSAGPVEAIGNVLVVMTPKESGGVATLDISDPTSPQRLASFSADKSYIGQFYRHWVFLISPLRAWDVLSDPRNIGAGSSPLGTLNHEGAEYLSFSDDYLFLGHVRTEIGGAPGASKITVTNPSQMRVVDRVWGRMDRNGKNDDQFSIALGNLLVLGDDQSPYAGWVIAAHQEEPDTTPPVVDSVVPKDGETGVSTQSRIGLSFSDNIELATVNGASFIVRPQGGAPLSGKYGVRMGVLNFDPDEDLMPGTTYEVVLAEGGVTDLVGNALAAEWTATFTTE